MRIGGNSAAEPTDDGVEIALCEEAVVALQFDGDVVSIPFVKEHDANVTILVGCIVNAGAQVVRLTGGSESCTGRLFPVETEKPRLTTYNNDFFGGECLITAPFRPLLRRTTRIRI